MVGDALAFIEPGLFATQGSFTFVKLSFTQVGDLLTFADRGFELEETVLARLGFGRVVLRKAFTIVRYGLPAIRDSLALVGLRLPGVRDSITLVRSRLSLFFDAVMILELRPVDTPHVLDEMVGLAPHGLGMVPGGVGPFASSLSTLAGSLSTFDLLRGTANGGIPTEQPRLQPLASLIPQAWGALDR